ncbi:NAD(+) diphosphatase [Pectobacterium parmentieri]|uniref:NAD-capped RNA hydrolase NudC n=1 Tax=Pectobacterium parmentieri TaxID=1905730 RepID=A0A0H3HYE3_PECPM|nr:NAD(+) diphosphatase [Pectobacterium parmentieri]AFI88364.1 NADH pyrophosphatase [Pectobacterium parmentieri]AOR60628.1 NADH pyrophosphatase [Pectobacterium parmentieri]AYH08436.1 NAD(+) diphosphatase [Pectobacterium parmentieri]AYH20820.1 NAD(+) diphosphatase [Pectobacterium parmentieri]AYH34793.1 NAD(+) diphosphatase [Pectobacterium parmentieri]
MEQTLKGDETGWWIVSDAIQIWLPQGELPRGTAIEWSLQGKVARQIGEWQGQPAWLVCQGRDTGMASVRQLLDQDVGLFQLAGRGVQLAEFYRSHRFCGYCGHEMVQSKTELACLCGHCKERYYPQIAPCIIVAIRRGKEILLAQHNRHRGNMYTVLAGFVEVGETLEQTVVREVMEESQIQIKNLRYVSSQPWPFPHSLMMAFVADYAGGEIKHDPKELRDAGWFRYDQLPQLPPLGTVARRLIEDTVVLCRAYHENEG